MKIRFWLLGLLLLGQPVAAGECDGWAHRAVQAAIEGNAVPRSAIPAKCLGTIDTPPRGSGNWPIMLRGSLYLTGQSEGFDLLPWLKGGEVWSHNGRENGSSTYEHWNAETALAVLWTARKRMHCDLEVEAERWLRALWAKYALAATPWQPRQTRFWQHKSRHERPRLRYMGYVGPSIHLVGNRQGEDPKRGKNTGSWVDVHSGHALLSWASDWPGRRYKQQFIKPGALSGALWTLQQLTGKKFGQSLEPEVFGLTQEERETLRGFLESPADPDLAREVAGWLEGYPYWRGTTVTFRRYRSGAVLTVLSGTFNASKSGAVVAFADRNASTWLVPSAYRGVKAARAAGSIEGARAVATSRDGGKWELPIPGERELAWQAVWSDQGIELEVPAAASGEYP